MWHKAVPLGSLGAVVGHCSAIQELWEGKMSEAILGVIIGGVIGIAGAVLGAIINHVLELRRQRILRGWAEEEKEKRLRRSTLLRGLLPTSPPDRDGIGLPIEVDWLEEEEEEEEAEEEEEQE